MAPIWATALLVLAGATDGGADAVWVALPADATPCRLESFAAALRARLGPVAVLAGAHIPETNEVAIALTAEGDRLSLRVSGAGRDPLLRQLPHPAADCLAASETAALMVERYLTDVGGRVDPDPNLAADPALSTAPGAAGGQPVAPPEPLGERLRQRAAPGPPAWQLALGAAALLTVADLPQLAPGQPSALPSVAWGGALEVGVQHGPWRLALRGLTTPPASTTVQGAVPNGRASLQLQAVDLQLALAYGLSVWGGELALALGPGTRLLWAHTDSSSGGQFGKTGAAFAQLPLLSARVGYGWPLWGRLSLVADLAVQLHLAQVSFAVAGVPADTAYSRQADGQATLGLGFLFF